VKLVIQRVTRASVAVEGATIAEIGAGALVLVGVARGDAEADAEALARKLVALRMFPGRTPMDLALGQVGGACLVVSQFTLCADLGKGNRPSFEPAEAPERADALYRHFAAAVAAAGIPVATGRFGADMAVSLSNDGPVTYLLEARGGKLVSDARQV
jgi:D-aminoacyl-tRNA deacylase